MKSKLSRSFHTLATLSISVGVLFQSQASYAWNSESLPSEFVNPFSNLWDNIRLSDDTTYQIGDEWGKKPVTPADLDRASAVFRRVAKATARYGGGTSFYLGKIGGHHLMATNYHVTQAYGCGARANFVLVGKSFACEHLYGEWSAIDLGIFSIRVNPADEAALEGLGKNFDYDADIYPGQELLTIGFGMGNNPQRQLVSNQDSDCKVFSEKNEFRFMGDPDTLNPSDYKAWSFASGCDVSHGDSGSAFVDRNTGDILGIVWTGRIPKPAEIRSSAYLEQIYKNHSEQVWTDLTYSVPAPKMREVLREEVKNPKLTDDERSTLTSMIER